MDAIFTSPPSSGYRFLLIGIGGILTGIAFWASVALLRAYPQYLGVDRIASFLPLLLTPMGFLFFTCGIGMCLGAISRPGTKTLKEDRGSRLRGPVSAQPSLGALSDDPSSGFTGRSALVKLSLAKANFRLGVVGFVQSIIILGLFSGFVDEYRSNATMQEWVRSVLPFGSYFMSLEALIITAIILSISVIRCLAEPVPAE